MSKFTIQSMREALAQVKNNTHPQDLNEMKQWKIERQEKEDERIREAGRKNLQAATSKPGDSPKKVRQAREYREFLDATDASVGGRFEAREEDYHKHLNNSDSIFHTHAKAVHATKEHLASQGHKVVDMSYHPHANYTHLKTKDSDGNHHQIHVFGEHGGDAFATQDVPRKITRTVPDKSMIGRFLGRKKEIEVTVDDQKRLPINLGSSKTKKK